MKTFAEIIEEGRQRGTLFHYTGANNAISVLDQNALGHGDEKPISMTRDSEFHKKPSGKWFQEKKGQASRNDVKTEVSFVVNGDKLSNNHRIRPYNYFQSGYWKRGNTPEYNEQEEQVSNKRGGNRILGFKSFVKKIRVHGNLSPEQLEKLKGHGIPIEHNK